VLILSDPDADLAGQVRPALLDCLDPVDQRRGVTFGYSERRIKGTASLLAPGRPWPGKRGVSPIGPVHAASLTDSGDD